jgi:hypothetical protein
MKFKPLIFGTLFYLGLLTLLFLTLFLVCCIRMPSVSLYVEVLLAFFCGAFLLKLTSKASFWHLSSAVLLFFSILTALLIFYGIMYSLKDSEFILGAMLSVWLFGSAGIATAKWTTTKWPGAQAHSLLIRLSFAPLILAIIGVLLFKQGTYLYSGIRSGQLGSADLRCDATALQTTRVIPELSAPILSGTNLIWCASFQLAWNEMQDLIGEAIRFAQDEPATVQRLNQQTVHRTHLDPETYLAFAGEYTSDFIRDIHSETQRKFGPQAFYPEQEPVTDGIQRLAAFGYLSANLPFKHAFQRSEYPMDFNGTPVQSFTLPYGSGSEEREKKANQQVQVIYPPEEGSFMVELLTRKSEHHLILARIAPRGTLAETVDKACTYADTLPRQGLELNQQLEVPLFNFDITKEYAGLTNKRLYVQNPDYAGWIMERAGQNLRFQLDERGALLRSSSMMVCYTCAPPTNCIFDEPFLLMLRYGDSPQPYFAMWVDNAEILVQ